MPLKHVWLMTLLMAVVGCSPTPYYSSSASSGETSSGIPYRVEEVNPAIIRKLLAEEKERNPVLLPAAAATESYHVGRNDLLLLRISVFAAEGDLLQVFPPIDEKREWAGVYIADDGTLGVPLIGEIKAEGLTIEALRKKIRAEYVSKDIYKDPQVEVRVLSYNSQRIAVTGEVTKPGEQWLTITPLSVVSALDAAGGLKETADLERATLRRQDGKIVPINLVSLLKEGDSRLNVQLLPGDTLNVPDNVPTSVFILGEALEPKVQPLRYGKLTLIEALANAKGWDKNTSTAQLYVVRGLVTPEFEKSGMAALGEPPQVPRGLSAVVYHIDASAPHALLLAEQFPLAPRDIIYIAPRSVTDWSRFISLLVPGSFLGLVDQISQYTHWRTTPQ